MKLIGLSIKNFRCYQEEIEVSLDNLITFVGKNDIGKSSVLEALEIFFNNDAVSIEPGDANVRSESKKVEITCEFSDLPGSLTLDATAQTSLADEYLLTQSGSLKLRKVFDCSTKKPGCEIFILANHPTTEGVGNLLELKEKELQVLMKAKGLVGPLKGNPAMRAALWHAAGDLALGEVAIPASKGKEDSKKLWEQIEAHLPIFALFQSDRSSRDSDDEVQNPMKAAIAAAISEVQEDIARIQLKVQEKAEAIARSTHAALKGIDPSLASELTPEFIPPTPAKWVGLFSMGLNTDSGIPLNKRGSGVRRLVLVSFFKAEAERRLQASSKRSIIYAIEEPETAQHPNNQKILIESFKSLANEPGCQVILTTHSPGFASELPVDSIRYVLREVATGEPRIQMGADAFGDVANALGVMPDSRVKVLLCVEGPNDVTAFKSLSRILHNADPTLPNLESDERFAFVPLGGGTLKHWVAQRYLSALNRPEVHIYDRDVAEYAISVQEVNTRTDGSWGALTNKHEMESYLHADAIQELFGFEIEVLDHPGADGKAVPKVFGEAFVVHRGHGMPLKDSTAKQKLAEAFARMTVERIRARDPVGEIEGWLRRIALLA